MLLYGRIKQNKIKKIYERQKKYKNGIYNGKHTHYKYVIVGFNIDDRYFI